MSENEIREIGNAERLHDIVKSKANYTKRTAELWAENWFFGVRGNMHTHIARRPVSDEYVGGLIDMHEEFASEQHGYIYGIAWVDDACVHILYDNHGAVWSATAVSMVWS